MKKTVTVVACVLLIATNFVTGVFADWYDDVKSGCAWVEIEGDEFVVDTFCGVEARYNESDYYYQCNELIMRFYKEAYNLDVLAYMNTGLIMLTEGYEFVEAQTPKKGDIIYVTADMRDSDADHWAIVKDYSNGYITMFEQNVTWQGKAALNRQIKYPSDSYYLLTPRSTGSAPDPVLRGVENETAKPTTTTAAETTSRPTTTAAETTTKAATTRPVTTTKPVTTTAPETTTEITTATTVPFSEASTTVLTETYSTAPSFEKTEKEDDNNNERKEINILPIAVCVVIGIVLVCALILLLVKKR